MIPEWRTRLDAQQAIEQHQQPGETAPVTPLAPPSGAMEQRPEAPPPAAPPPTPPRGRLAASIQRMPPAGRWALGLGLAFLSGVAYLFSPYGSAILVGSAVVLLGMLVLALAAGVVLSSWRPVLALAVATAAGAVVGSWVVIQTSTAGTSEGPTGLGGVFLLFLFFAILGLVPLIVFLLAGVGLGKQQGITLGQPYALSAREASVSRWVAAIAPLIGAGLLAPSLGYLPGMQFGAWFLVTGMLTAIVLAATCLLAGWLLRSWWGLMLGPVVYAGVALLATVTLPFFGGGGDWQVWPVGWALYILLPAVVMSAIGTAIGTYRARRAGQHPQQGQPATY